LYVYVYSVIVCLYVYGGNRSTPRKPPTCRKSLVNLHNVLFSTPRHHGVNGNAERLK